MSDPTHSEPLLRTLAPALCELERSLRTWLGGTHCYPMSTLTRATLEGLSTDLRRQSEALSLDRPLLVIMLMGGTGVGKSTLLNALAGGAIAEASFARPTTRDPVVYYHQSIQPNRLDAALQHCKLASHDRPNLEQKILVDTPDLDSNDLANREKLIRLLPVADIVLYVGSQEKYHDKLGWDLFLHQRQRRAFAFVLNKWDRCIGNGGEGLRPDEDLLRDLEAEGFQNPLLFRTCAQRWIDRPSPNGDPNYRPPDLPEGEQFLDLMHWLEMGLTRLEIEAIKARGVSQLLHQMQRALENACPPDLTDIAAKVRAAWMMILAEEAKGSALVLLNTLEPYQREIEHHFALERQGHFRGLMATYLHVFNRMKYAGSTLRSRIPFLPRASSAAPAPASWDLSAFTRVCSTTASERHLDARGRALANRLLVEADHQGFPLALISEPTERLGKIDWRQRYAQALAEVLGQVEHQWSEPTGTRRWLQTAIVFLANWLPMITLVAAAAVPLFRWFNDKTYEPALMHFLMPFFVVLLVLIVLHVLIALFLPLRWVAIRGEFHKLLEERMRVELEQIYAAVPAEVAEALKAERRQVEHLLAETREVTGWLEQREQAASIAGLYGK